MTPKEFSDRMEAICGLKNISAVKDAGMLLITRELGEGMPAFLPALEVFAARLHRDDDSAFRNERAARRTVQNVRADL